MANRGRTWDNHLVPSRAKLPIFRCSLAPTQLPSPFSLKLKLSVSPSPSVRRETPKRVRDEKLSRRRLRRRRVSRRSARWSSRVSPLGAARQWTMGRADSHSWTPRWGSAKDGIRSVFARQPQKSEEPEETIYLPSRPSCGCNHQTDKKPSDKNTGCLVSSNCLPIYLSGKEIILFKCLCSSSFFFFFFLMKLIYT